MRSILCLLVVCLFATTAAAQFEQGRSYAAQYGAGRGRHAKENDERKGDIRVRRAAADQAGADADLADALLIAMDTDHDGIVTKIEMSKAMAALAESS